MLQQRLFALAEIKLEEAFTWSTLYRDDFQAIEALNYCPDLENQAIDNGIRSRIKNHCSLAFDFPSNQQRCQPIF
jgi:hypothetical protein